MKDINVINYLNKSGIEIPEYINLSAVSLPSLENKSTEIKNIKNKKKHADMKFTFSNPDYSGLGDKFEWAKSCIIVSYNYGENYKTNIASSLGNGAIARFAIEDYYLPIKRFIDQLKLHFDKLNLKTQEFIDSPNHYDRLFFQKSGLGWQGKSSMMLAPGIGPWQLIGNLYVEKEFKPFDEKTYSCGTCNLCQISCPTGALDNEYQIDSTKCISYWLQSPKIIPDEMRIKIANRFYGCDDCLLSCPPGQNKFINFKSSNEVDLNEIINMDNKNLISKFSWFYVPKRNADYLKRNAITALANNPRSDSYKLFERLLDASSEIIRLYSVWALWRVDKLNTINKNNFYKSENSKEVLSEFERLIK